MVETLILARQSFYMIPSSLRNGALFLLLSFNYASKWPVPHVLPILSTIYKYGSHYQTGTHSNILLILLPSQCRLPLQRMGIGSCVGIWLPDLDRLVSLTNNKSESGLVKGRAHDACLGV